MQRERSDDLLGGRPDPIPALTGLRIVGAAWVVLFHFQSQLYAASSKLLILSPVVNRGDFGVPLFFILSGYIIWHNYGSSRLLTSLREPVRFIWRRFARLWPVNILGALLAIPTMVLTIKVVNYWGAPVPPWYSMHGWLGSAFMIAPLAAPTPVFTWNQPAWTLTGEMLAYLLFPLMLLFAVRIRSDRARLACMPAAVIVAFFARANFVEYPYQWILDLIPLFVAGVLLRLAGRPRSTSWMIGQVQIAVPIAIVISCYLNVSVAIAPLLVVGVWSLSATSGPLVRFFSTHPMQVAGLASYSVYMLHWIVLSLASLVIAVAGIRGHFLLLCVPAVLGAVWVVAWLTWRFVETPARKGLNLAFERLWPGVEIASVSEEALEEAAAHSIEKPVEQR